MLCGLILVRRGRGGNPSSSRKLHNVALVRRPVYEKSNYHNFPLNKKMCDETKFIEQDIYNKPGGFQMSK